MASERGAAAIRNTLRMMLIAAVGLVLASLGGCASGSSISSIFNGSTTGGREGPAPVSFAPIIGPPPAVSQQISGQVAAAAQQKNIPVVSDSAAADFTVRGYLDASPDRQGNKLAFIWDVLDKSGNRVHRIIGEEVVPAKPGSDPWKSLDKASIDKVAVRTATDLAAWLPTKAGSAPAAVASSERQQAPAADRRPTASSPSENAETKVMVAAVRGAPGDGQKSLTLALKKQLFKRGLKLTSASGAGVYTVQGKVTVSSAGSGQQDVKIDWQVSDPRGKELATISQAGRMPQGAVDKEWGPAADSAAGAAADEIAKLIPKT